ncbi:MAG: hypothetical protein M3Q07_19915 [Pseudobdellovibrionaceae bacterium]|nr:hypothetical protein [Pseudobdellovibrionaceae bacterium]
MKRYLAFTLVFSSTSLIGGSGGGIGTPPSVSEEIMSLLNSDRDLMTTVGPDNKVILLSRSELAPILRLNQQSRISEADLDLLSELKTVSAIQANGGTQKNYQVEDGDSLGSYTLIDRRELIRSSLNKENSKPVD